MTYEETMKEAFPDVDPGIQPFGSRVLVQIRTAKTKTSGGIILTGLFASNLRYVFFRI